MWYDNLYINRIEHKSSSFHFKGTCIFFLFLFRNISKLIFKLKNDFKWFLTLKKNSCSILMRYDLCIFPVFLCCQVYTSHLEFSSVLFCMQLDFDIFGNYRTSRPFRSSAYGLNFKQIHFMGDSVLTVLFGFLKKASELSLSEEFPTSHRILEFSVGTLKCLSVDCDLKYEVWFVMRVIGIAYIVFWMSKSNLILVIRFYNLGMLVAIRGVNVVLKSRGAYVRSQSVSLLSKKVRANAASVFFQESHQIRDWSHAYSDTDSLLPLKDFFFFSHLLLKRRII